MKNPAIEELKTHCYTNSPILIQNCAVKTVYAFSNENLRDFFANLKIFGGRIVTVGSSGDQLFNSIYYGANEITLVDANPYAKPLVELKKAAIENMPYKDFMNYWNVGQILQYENYKDILPFVSEETRAFLKEFEIYQKHVSYKKAEGEVIDSYSFERFVFVDNRAEGKNFSNGSVFYDNEKCFNYLKSKLKDSEIQFELAEYSNFPKILKGEYDSILVSNIYNYYPESAMFFDVAKTLIDNNLVKYGTMQMHYSMSKYTLFRENFGLYMEGYNPCKEYLIDKPYMVNTENKKEKPKNLFEYVRGRFDGDMKEDLDEDDDSVRKDEVFIYEKDV